MLGGEQQLGGPAISRHHASNCTASLNRVVHLVSYMYIWVVASPCCGAGRARGLRWQPADHERLSIDPERLVNTNIVPTPLQFGWSSLLISGRLYSDCPSTMQCLVQGIVLEAFGAGNIPDLPAQGWMPWLRQQRKKGLQVSSVAGTLNLPTCYIPAEGTPRIIYHHTTGV